MMQQTIRLPTVRVLPARGGQTLVTCQTCVSAFPLARKTAAAVLAAGLLLGAPAASQADPLTFTVVSKDVQQKLKDRDEAMKFSCKSMFDCDGDRREYAHNQYSKFEKRMASKGNALPRGDDSEEAAAAAAAAAEGPPK